MDAVSSPAVFRTVLEDTPAAARQMLDSLSDPFENAIEMYRGSHLYKDVHDAVCLLTRPGVRAALQNHIEFYVHSAICWMVVADEELYHQPYSFGRDPRGNQQATIGPYLPVFKYERKLHSYPFDVFEDHFRKMWETSSLTKLAEAERRMQDSSSHLKEIFTKRLPWLGRACQALGQPVKRPGGLGNTIGL